MTTGILGDDEGLLTEQDAAELLQVSLQGCVSARSLGSQQA